MARSQQSRRELADFLQDCRRSSSPPTSGGHRRTPGLRREEVALLANISVDYYTRLEQGRAGSMPTPQVIDGLASAFDLTRAEGAHLYRLTGRSAPEHAGDETSESLSFLLGALEGTPAQVVDDLGFVLDQNEAGHRLFTWVGERGLAVANVYELWFLDPAVRAVFPETERRPYSRAQAGELRAAVARRALVGDSRGEEFVGALLDRSSEFVDAWEAREVHDGRAKTLWLPGRDGGVAYTAYVTIDGMNGQRLIALERT
ncbi:helix-turn-helix domain-containing protein [Janibacter sp. G349]|uniref:helix-turn-helix domain-containing protein n=1 Tax=unclassified Janibacter TaxID=2649294 RepID=UPI003B7ECC66